MDKRYIICGITYVNDVMTFKQLSNLYMERNKAEMELYTYKQRHLMELTIIEVFI